MKQSVQELTTSLLIVLSVCGAGAASAGNVVPEQEYAKKIKASERLEPLTSTLFGDSVSLYNGAIAFTQVDIRFARQQPLARPAGPDDVDLRQIM